MLPTVNMRRLAMLTILVCSVLIVSGSPIASNVDATSVDVSKIGAEITAADFDAENNNKDNNKHNNKHNRHPDECRGVEPLNSTYYFCRNWLLGPKELPTRFPLNDITHPYLRFGGLTAAEFLARWTLNGSYTFPPQAGFQLDTMMQPIQGNMTLYPDTLVDRFGGENGTYLSPAEAPFPQRALPPLSLDTPTTDKKYPFNYHVYIVTKPFVVLAGPIAPYYGQPGQGVQYHTYTSIMNLVAGGFLGRVPLNHSKLF